MSVCKAVRGVTWNPRYPLILLPTTSTRWVPGRFPWISTPLFSFRLDRFRLTGSRVPFSIYASAAPLVKEESLPDDRDNWGGKALTTFENSAVTFYGYALGEAF